MKMTVKQVAQKYNFLTESSLRWYLFNRESNGLASAVTKLGRKILIDDEKFENWVNSFGEA